MSDLPPPPPPPPLASSSSGGNLNNAAAAAAAAAAADPNAVVQKIVEELKSQGIFDQIRNECLAEVDTKVS